MAGRRTAIAIGAAGVLGALAVLMPWRGGGGDPFAACRTGQIAGAADIGGPFTLVDGSGATVTDADVITAPSLIYFGYTFCPDVCPLDVARNAQAVDVLAERGYRVTPIFISIDPERDTPDAVDAFATNNHPRMIGLTGSPDQVAAASRAYRTFFRKHTDEDPEFYLVDHSTFTYFVTPEDGFVEFFRRELDPAALADRVQCFLDAGA
ncbi:MAG: SCO family protein [Rhodobacteraceae bacterium]|jgi:protein SCO1/2|nr:SCO family protein [Paracoccaceae bacterium]MBL4557904.1 SCO family protein [Paracoccaceae bacterium]